MIIAARAKRGVPIFTEFLPSPRGFIASAAYIHASIPRGVDAAAHPT
jgi:hypothetical protein